MTKIIEAFHFDRLKISSSFILLFLIFSVLYSNLSKAADEPVQQELNLSEAEKNGCRNIPSFVLAGISAGRRLS
jgi:hypothetical protein